MAQESIGECEAAGNGRINEPIECCSYRSYFIAHSMHNKGKNVTIFKINSIRNWNSLTSMTVEIECKRGPVNDIPETTYTEAEPLIVFIIFSNALLDWQERRSSPFRHQMQFNNTVISSVFIFSFHFISFDIRIAIDMNMCMVSGKGHNRKDRRQSKATG